MAERTDTPTSRGWRRRTGTLAVATITAASIAAGTHQANADPPCGPHTAAFGWEANNLHDRGANLILPVTQPIHVTQVTVDYSMTRVQGRPDGWREALTYLAVNPTGTMAKTRQPLEPGAPGWGASRRTGAVSHGGGMSDRIFAQAILKNGYDGDQIVQPLDVTLARGDRVFVHADAYGARTDVEAQGSLSYTTCV